MDRPVEMVVPAVGSYGLVVVIALVLLAGQKRQRLGRDMLIGLALGLVVLLSGCLGQVLLDTWD
jgi:hypothetical protein